MAVFEGKAEGIIIEQADKARTVSDTIRSFIFPAIGKTFAELTPEEKAKYSHRGAAFRAFLEWYRAQAVNSYSDHGGF